MILEIFRAVFATHFSLQSGRDVVERLVDEGVEPFPGGLARIDDDDVPASLVGVGEAERALASEFFLHGSHEAGLPAV